jgi:hypothetical protein
MVRQYKYLFKLFILFINTYIFEYFQVNAVTPHIGPCIINAGKTPFSQIKLTKLPGVNSKLKCTDKGT